MNDLSCGAGWSGVVALGLFLAFGVAIFALAVWHERGGRGHD